MERWFPIQLITKGPSWSSFILHDCISLLCGPYMGKTASLLYVITVVLVYFRNQTVVSTHSLCYCVYLTQDNPPKHRAFFFFLDWCPPCQTAIDRHSFHCDMKINMQTLENLPREVINPISRLYRIPYCQVGLRALWKLYVRCIKAHQDIWELADIALTSCAVLKSHPGDKQWANLWVLRGLMSISSSIGSKRLMFSKFQCWNYYFCWKRKESISYINISELLKGTICYSCQ